MKISSIVVFFILFTIGVGFSDVTPRSQKGEIETIERIITDEGGLRMIPYFCKAGKLSWLIARNIEDRPLYEYEVEILRMHGLARGGRILFNQEIVRLRRRLIALGVDMNTLPEEVHNILLNQSYQMGLTSFNPNEWPNYFQCLKERDWKQAAKEGRDSKWWKIQTRKRAERLMRALEDCEVK